MKKYSKVYLIQGEQYFGFRYNYTAAILEYVSKWDCKIVGTDLVDIILDDWQVTDSIGLSKSNWEDNPEYWIDTYKDELDAETAYLARFI